MQSISESFYWLTPKFKVKAFGVDFMQYSPTLNIMTTTEFNRLKEMRPRNYYFILLS